MAMKISATIIARDEQAKIGRAIRSLRFCDEVVVVDSGSTDGTMVIARALGARVFEKPWLGYATQKNEAASLARNDWILSIDADEMVTDELRDEILELDGDKLPHAGYDFPRLARYCGQWIRHCGWYPDRKVRLYHRDRARWEGQYVHEAVAVSGSVGHLAGDLLHYTCDSLESHVDTIELYTDLAAAEIYESGKRTPRWRMWLGPLYAFFKVYFLKLGFLEGKLGFTIARMAAFYVLQKYAKARALDAILI